MKRGETEREMGKGERREIAERLVVGLVAIVMACAIVPMCQPPWQLSPLVRSAVKYAETSKPFARVKLVVITRIDILYICARIERALFKSSPVDERMLAIERKCGRFVHFSNHLTVTLRLLFLSLSLIDRSRPRRKLRRLFFSFRVL